MKKLSCVIIGDMNIDLIMRTSHTQTAEYSNSLLTDNFMPLMVPPSRITPHSFTLTDPNYFFFGGRSKWFDAGRCSNIIHDYQITYLIVYYHFLIRVKLQTNRPAVRRFSEQVEQQLRDQLLAVDWNEIISRKS